ncbi:MAG: SDR family oxidoreductase [Rhodospirillales bacterium]|nr:MAG: SDR family oxidoreductase [Rhodospirillales bacterium]
MPGPILIFGATGGVGSALAQRLHASGRPLFLSARDSDRLSDLARALDAPSQAADVLDETAVAGVVKAASAQDGLAGLAFCVGSIVLKPLKSVTPNDFAEAFRLNTIAAAMAVAAARDGLTRGNGAVVLFSTVAVAQGFTNHAVISAAKGGVEGLTRALAAELAPHVRVNAVAPSLTRTRMATPITGNETMAKGIAQLHALPRLGAAEDQASAAAFLLDPQNSWITGQVIPVDGGRSRVRTKG